MIHQMSKYSFLIYHKEYEDFLLRLRALGVVHVSEHTDPRTQAELQALIEERNALLALRRSYAQLVPETKEETLPQTASDPAEHQPQSAVQECRQSLEKLTALRTKRAQLSQEIKSQEPWGDFSLERVQALQQAGYELAFYSASLSSYTPDFETQYEAIPIARVGSQQYFVRLISLHQQADPQPQIPAERISTPSQSLQELMRRMDQSYAEEETLMHQLRAMRTRYLHAIAEADRELTNRYSLGAARLQGLPEAGDSLMWLEGWVPTADAPDLEQALHAEGYFCQATEIKEEDRIPIKLKNSAFTRLFEPITGMFSLPNYGEFDQTVLFAPFFMLFFGLCMGDAGYGVLIFAVATVLRLRTSGATKDIAALVQWLGAAAALTGLATGSLFGTTLGYATDKGYIFHQDNMMTISVAIGLVQILFAKGVAAYKTKVQRGTKYALAPFAWIILLLGIGAVIGLPMLELSLPQWVHYVVYTMVGLSALVVFFFNSPGKNPLLNFGTGLWNAYNVISGLLGDTLSYIRLYAIGLTGAILGGVFNGLAIEQTEGLPAVLRFIVAGIILILGHGLNISLAMISSFVHPLRLTFVEYYKNSEFEGGGTAYAPLKEEQ